MIFVIQIAAILVMIGGVSKVISTIFFMFIFFVFLCYQILNVLVAKKTFSLQQKIMNLEQRNTILEDTARNLKTTLTHFVREVGMLQVKYDAR